MTRVSVAAVAVVLAVAAATTAVGSHAPGRTEAATPAAGAFAGPVALEDGRRIYMECRGAGSPVVLDAGVRSRSDFWVERQPETRGRTVFPGIARFTRVCIYDRPGTTLGTEAFSRSDPVPMPRTAKDAVADLRALLRAARLRGPHVLAGHSTGGLIVRLYASTYPSQVAGLVEVDALSEFLQGPLNRAQIIAYDELNNGPLPGLEAYADLEQILFRPSFGQMRRADARRPLGRMPIVVISRRLPLPVPPGLPEGLTTPVLETAWRAGQNELATMLPGARWVIATRSSHYVMFSQPALIIGAVRDVVDEVRRS